MKTAYCPRLHNQLASVSSGAEYGHVPGHTYHDVDVVISRRGDVYRCHVVETWGSSQGGPGEEHGRNEVIGRGCSIRYAVNDARTRAERCGMHAGYLERSLSLAEDDAEERGPMPMLG